MDPLPVDHHVVSDQPVYVKSLRELPLHLLDCPWIFRLGECTCARVDRMRPGVRTVRILDARSIVFAYDRPMLAGWSSLGWWIVRNEKLFVVSSLVRETFEDLFGEP